MSKGKKKVITLFLVLLVVAILTIVISLCLRQFSSRSKNLSDSTAKATLTINNDNSYGINGTDLVKEATKYLGSKYQSGSFDCWDFVQKSMTDAGASNVAELSNWYTGNIATITANSVTSNVNYIVERENVSDKYWTQGQIANMMDKVPMGTLFAGSATENYYTTGHGFIYLGYFDVSKYSNKEQAVANWLSKYGITVSTEYIKYYSNYEGYWIIDNSSKGVTINNAAWGRYSSGWKTIKYLTLIQVTNPPSVQKTHASITFNINKTSERKSEKKVNAKFNYTLKDGTGADAKTIKSGTIIGNDSSVTIGDLNYSTSGDTHYYLLLKENTVTGYKNNFSNAHISDIVIDKTGNITSFGSLTDDDGNVYKPTKKSENNYTFNLVNTPESKEISLNINKKGTDGNAVKNATFDYWVSDEYLVSVVNGTKTGSIKITDGIGKINNLFTAYYDDNTLTKYIYLKETSVDNYSKGYFEEDNNYLVMQVKVTPTLEVSMLTPQNNTYCLLKGDSKFTRATNGTNYIKNISLNGNTITAEIEDPDTVDVSLDISKAFEDSFMNGNLSISGIDVDYNFSYSDTFIPGGIDTTSISGKMEISTNGSVKGTPDISVKKGTTLYLWMRESTDADSSVIFNKGIFEDPEIYIYMKITVDDNGNVSILPVDNSNYLVKVQEGNLTYINKEDEINKYTINGKEGYYVDTNKIVCEQAKNWGKATIKATIYDELNAKDYKLYAGKTSKNYLEKIRHDVKESGSISNGDMLSILSEMNENSVSGCQFYYISGWRDSVGGIYNDNGNKCSSVENLTDGKIWNTEEKLKLLDENSVNVGQSLLLSRFFAFYEISSADGYNTGTGDIIIVEFNFDWTIGENTGKVKGVRTSHIDFEGEKLTNKLDRENIAKKIVPQVLYDALGTNMADRDIARKAFNIDLNNNVVNIVEQSLPSDENPYVYAFAYLTGAENGNYGTEIKEDDKIVEKPYYSFSIGSYVMAAVIPDMNEVYIALPNSPKAGEYKLNIGKAKKGEFNNLSYSENLISDAEFSAETTIYGSSHYELGVSTNTKTVTTGKSLRSVIDSKLSDEYTIDSCILQETVAPNGCELYEHKIKVEFTKAVYNYETSTQQRINVKEVYISIDINDDNEFNEKDGEYYQKIVWSYDKGNLLTGGSLIDNTIYFNVESEASSEEGIISPSFVFVMVDDKVPEGSYKMNIVKKELKNTQEDNYEGESATYKNGLAGAKYNVTQYINYKGVAYDSKNTFTPTTELGREVSITGGLINITDTLIDYYEITEENAPAGYNKTAGVKIGLYVYKTLDEVENKYKVDYIGVMRSFPGYIAQTDFIENASTLYVKKGYGSNEYFEDYEMAFELKEDENGETTLNITWRNEEPEWGVSLEKIDSEGEPIKTETASFNVSFYGDETLSAEKTFYNAEGNEIATIQDTNENGEINLPNIKAPTEAGTYYMVVEETKAPGTEYVLLEGKLIIPITFSINEDGIYEISLDKENAYLKLDDETTTPYEEAEISINWDSENSNITIYYPNQKSDFSLVIAKVDKSKNTEDAGYYVPGVTFTVNGNNYTTGAANTDNEGIAVVESGRILNSGEHITYEITEINTGDNQLVKLKNPVTADVLVISTIGKGYVVGRVFFSDSNTNTLTAELEDGTNVELNIEYNKTLRLVTITIPNMPDKEVTTFTVNKKWNVDNPDKYRVTLALNKTINGETTEAKETIAGEEKTVTKTITGNGTVVFENLAIYEGTDKIEYSVKETLIEKTEDGGTTWNEVSMQDYIVETDKGLTKLSDTVEVGDYVNYNSVAEKEYTYTTDETLTGNAKTSTFSSNESMKWRVLSVDKQKGIVELIPADVTKSTITLEGKTGYKNAKLVLNNASAVYGHGYGAQEARSINLNDVIQYSSYNNSDYTSIYGYKYGASKEYTSGTFLNEDGTETIASTENPVTKAQTASWYIAKSYYAREPIYQTLFRSSDDSSNKSYWLASYSNYLNTDVCGFFVNSVDNGNLDGGKLYASDDTKGAPEYAVVPVVTLKAGIKTSGQNADGTWVITEGTTVVNTQKKEVSKNKKWEGVDNPQNYEATFELYKVATGEDTTNVTIEVNSEKLEKVVGKDTITVTGNDTATFTNLPVYEGSTKIEYRVIEIGAKYYNTETKTWYSLTKDVDYTVKDENGTVVNTLSRKTKLPVSKKWNVDNPNRYRATYKLYKVTGNNESGEETLAEVTGIAEKTITGNNSTVFENLPEYEGTTKIEYRAQETKIEKLEDDGKTWTQISMDDFELIKAGSKSNVTRLADVVEVGDYVNYNAATGGVYSYVPEQSLTGNSKTSTFSSNETMKWRVLSVNKTTGIVELMAADTTANTVTLEGKTGYKNAETVLNNIGKVYGHGNGATRRKKYKLRRYITILKLQ